MNHRNAMLAATILGALHDVALGALVGDHAVEEQSVFDKLDQVTATATDPGNAFANDYLHGMANGLLLAQAIVYEREPQFLEKPAREPDAYAEPVASRASADLSGRNGKVTEAEAPPAAPDTGIDYMQLEREREQMHRREREVEALRSLRAQAVNFAMAHTIHTQGSVNDLMSHADRIEQFLLVGSAANGARAH